MIWAPKAEQEVHLHYGRGPLGLGARYQDRGGIVVVAARGRGPRNALVRLDEDKSLVVVPRGNLRWAMGGE